jgi:hypothetical protein
VRGLVLAALLLCGCVSSAPEGQPTSATPPAANATLAAPAPPPPVGERSALAAERFLLAANRSLAFSPNGTLSLPLEKVKEGFAAPEFFSSTDPASLLKPWPSNPARRAYEITQDVPITIRFSSDQPGVTMSKALGFPPVGGWLGTPDRWAVYFSAADAPDTLEAGKVYLVHATAKVPPGGLFVREGEPLALHPYLAYATPDDSPASYVVGGPDAAGIVVPHVHFNVSAPNATLVYDKQGTLSPNPSQTTTQDPQPTDISLKLPAGAVYLVAEATGTATGGGRVDVDLALRAGGKTLGEGTGPAAREIVVLGPTALAMAGDSLVAHVAGAAPAGGTFKLTVTAYGS